MSKPMSRPAIKPVQVEPDVVQSVDAENRTSPENLGPRLREAQSEQRRETPPGTSHLGSSHPGTSQEARKQPGPGPVTPGPVTPESEQDGRSKADAPGAAEAAPPGEKRGPGKKKLILGLVGALAIAAAIGYGVRWWTVGRFLVSTDDAYVGADIAQLSARVAGRIASVPAATNQHVRKGDALAVLDDTDYRLAVDQAKAKLATQEAAVTRFVRQIEAAKAAVVQARAQLDSANAENERAQADFKRIEALAKSQYNSVASLDTSRANRDKALASVEAAKAGITSAEANILVLEAQKTEARRTADELRVAVAKAQWDLDATVVRAPIDGYVGNKSVQVGDYVTAGKRLAAVVPDEAVYIDANFKETQLAGIHPGARVTVAIDAVDGKPIEGTVVSIAPATGAQFSLLPPENATGNFTKIVQRVPVRIAVPRSVVARGVLRPGLSVVATVDLRTGTAGSAAAGTRPSGEHTRTTSNMHATSNQGATR
ncbi:MAG: HlyD family secretion protein [Hyphomicrobiaceae bacterium]